MVAAGGVGFVCSRCGGEEREEVWEGGSERKGFRPGDAFCGEVQHVRFRGDDIGVSSVEGRDGHSFAPVDEVLGEGEYTVQVVRTGLEDLLEAMGRFGDLDALY